MHQDNVQDRAISALSPSRSLIMISMRHAPRRRVTKWMRGQDWQQLALGALLQHQFKRGRGVESMRKRSVAGNPGNSATKAMGKSGMH